MNLGAIDKSDVTYFNGEKVGSITMQDREDAWRVPRIYTVPGVLVRTGKNVIAVRVHSAMYDSGIIGPSAIMSLHSPAIPQAKPISLAGTWRYMVETNYGKVDSPLQPLAPGNVNAPAALFNGMIAPLTSFAIRGVIWYQGEGNADRPICYRALFPALIQDWRRHWGLDDLAFHFVQLANYIAVKDQPGEGQWAELREAQIMALRLPHTGMAVTIDIGETDNIHPRNKQDVGLRLALTALHGEYGRKEVTPCGPLFREIKQEGNAIRVLFNNAEAGLVCWGKKLQGFVIAGADRAFVWASARIENGTVLVSCPSVPSPQFVRYAWADNPTCNLYNIAGLPAAPFRSDTAQ